MMSCQYNHLVSFTINWLDKDLVPMVGEGEELDVPSPAEVGLLANLETLCLCRFGGSLHQIATFISRCEKLKVVEFHQKKWTLSDEDLSLLMGPLRRVGHITLAVRVIGDGDLSKYLALGPERSRSFTVGPSQAPDLNSLVLHAKWIRSLTLSVKTNIWVSTQGVALQRFLMEASSLEELRALPLEDFTDFGGYQHERVKIEHMVDRARRSAPGNIFLKTWACWETLTCLEVAFESKWPVFDKDGDERTLTIKSKDDHAILYGQLATFKGLEHLRLGPRRASGAFGTAGSYGTFPVLSIESGLKDMAGLVRLRTLDVRWVAHQVHIPGLEWMREGWTSLEAIPGLLELPPRSTPTCHWQVDKVSAWMSRHPRGVGRLAFQH